jgi:hypothetical protein
LCHAGKFTFVTYQLYDRELDLSGGVVPQHVTDTMLHDVDNVYQLRNVEVETARPYAYFYHFGSEGVGKRYPWRIVRMQGRNRTLYAGCSVSFESVNDLMAYNKMLLDQVIEVE